MIKKNKFRAWDKKEHVMDFPTAIEIDDSGKIDAVNTYHRKLRGDEFLLEQYTGLKDKNGKEIYEGDIVEIKNHPFQKKPDTLTGIQIDGKRIIEWSDAGCWCAGTLLLAKLIPWIKVIGNIHEDGQLLEADK